jgi:mono/diheme cytochrome c family protein
MPAQNITDQDIRDMMVMGQDATAFPDFADLTAQAAAQAAYAAADGVAGARLFDHPLNQAGISGTVDNDHSNFFRCKSCHGWDLLGPYGVNKFNVASLTKPATAPVNLMEVRANDGIIEIFNNIKNIPSGRDTGVWDDTKRDLMPKFGQILTDAQIWDLVKFIKETAHDVSDFYDMDISGTAVAFSNIGTPSKDASLAGDPVAGLATYTSTCSGCHGADGTGINIYCRTPNPEYLGGMFRGDPHEIQHKAIWGMPIDAEHIAAGCAVPFGGSMNPQNITDQDIRNMMVMGQDATAFPGI